MDVINIAVIGEKSSGKSTFVQTLGLTKFNYNMNIDMSTHLINLHSNYDIVFYLFEINDNPIDDTYDFSQLENCLIIPIFNKLDQHDFTVDEKSTKIVVDTNLNDMIDKKINQLRSMCENFQKVTFCNEKIICSAEYAYIYLYLSTCSKFSPNPQLIAKIGHYQLGKFQWNKKSQSEKTAYASALISQLKKSNNLCAMLNEVGYCVQSVVNKYIDSQITNDIICKHLKNFQIELSRMIKTQNILPTLKFACENFACLKDPTYLNDHYPDDIKNVTNELSTYINNYDYTLLDFKEKSEILQFYKNNTSQLLANINNDSCVEFLTSSLSEEIGSQLHSCETFTDLIDKLYDCLDINDDVYVDQIILNHKTFAMLLFSDNLKENLEYAFQKFDLDVKMFCTQIIEMKLQKLFNNDVTPGVVESMLCVKDFFENSPDLIHEVPSLRKYRILLNCALASKISLCDKEILLNKIDNESTLYVENMYYNEIITK